MNRILYIIIFFIIISCNNNTEQTTISINEDKEFEMNSINYKLLEESYSITISEGKKLPDGFEVIGQIYVSQDTLPDLQSMMEMVCEDVKGMDGEGIISLKIDTSKKEVMISGKVIKKAHSMPTQTTKKRKSPPSRDLLDEPIYIRDYSIEIPE